MAFPIIMGWGNRLGFISSTLSCLLIVLCPPHSGPRLPDISITISPGAKTIKENTNSTQNKSQTLRVKQYEVTSFLSTYCELSTETCSKNVYSLGPRSPLPYFLVLWYPRDDTRGGWYALPILQCNLLKMVSREQLGLGLHSIVSYTVARKAQPFSFEAFFCLINQN